MPKRAQQTQTPKTDFARRCDVQGGSGEDTSDLCGRLERALRDLMPHMADEGNAGETEFERAVLRAQAVLEQTPYEKTLFALTSTRTEEKK